MRVLVTGSRWLTKNDWPMVRDALEGLLFEFDVCLDDEYKMPDPNKITIVHGANPKGADRLADDWCAVNWIVPETYPADWDKYGKAAGPIRNQQMLDTGIDLVLAFPTKESKGTWHMVKIAHAAGVPVRIIQRSQEEVHS
jgi:hypothetical protein